MSSKYSNNASLNFFKNTAAVMKQAPAQLLQWAPSPVVALYPHHRLGAGCHLCFTNEEIEAQIS